MNHDFIFFDGECSFCCAILNKIALIDKENRFLFSPLKSSFAEAMIPDLLQKNTLVLLERHRGPQLRGKAAMRIFWLIGGKWKLLGVFHFLPSLILDPFYRLTAQCRYLFFKKSTLNVPRARFKD